MSYVDSYKTRRSASLQSLTAFAAQFDRATLILLAAWALVFICVPILRWNFGEDGLTLGITLGVLAQVVVVAFVTAQTWGVRRTLATFTLVIALGWLVEFVGHTTGFPFGGYDYTPRFQPQLGGVPLLIPLAWLMMLPPAWALATLITRRGRGAAFVVVSAVALTAWDFFLDPQMVTWGAWVFDDPSTGAYVGIIPWSNFAGWLLAAALITLAARPARLPAAPMLAIYAITWALHLIGQLAFWGLPASGIIGGIVMGAVLLLAIVRGRDSLC
jgi:lycopene beta-cyclase